MAWSFVNSAAGNTGVATSASSVSLTLPASLQANDLLIVQLVKQPSVNTLTFKINSVTQTFTAIPSRDESTTGSTNNCRSYLAYYVLAGTESGQTLQVTFSDGGDVATLGAVVYRGLNVSSPIDISSGAVSSASVTSKATASVTTTQDNDLLLSFFGKMYGTGSGTDTLSTPASTTSRLESHAQTQAGLLIVEENITPAGATSARTSSLSNASAMVAQAVAFKTALSRTHQMLV